MMIDDSFPTFYLFSLVIMHLSISDHIYLSPYLYAAYGHITGSRASTEVKQRRASKPSTPQ